MQGDQIRSSFIQFFESKGHLPMPSASLIPAGDPTLLFTSAGMVPFKPFFMGEQTPPSRRLTSCQKSFRTTDIDEVGDHKHLTFFEMLGNFSIGDYFKKEAIAFAWELVTQGFKLPPDRLFVTVHLDDDEAYQLWRDYIGVPEERIYRYGDKDNWWGPAGTEGPTGPCSEIHYDGGPEKGCGPMLPPEVLTAQLREEGATGERRSVPGCHPNCDCQRFVELWNLVFMQYYQDPKRNRTPLPAPSVDTGMGLERAAAILQGKPNVYETDLFWPIVQKVCELTGSEYGADQETDYALRVVAEHARAACFLIGDGVVPGNEGRGYVLRRIIRRAIRYGRRLGLEGPFLAQVAEAAMDRFRDVYPELTTNRGFILRVIGLEEERFARTFATGLHTLVQGLVPLRRRLRDVHERYIPKVKYALEALSHASRAAGLEEQIEQHLRNWGLEVGKDIGGTSISLTIDPATGDVTAISGTFSGSEPILVMQLPMPVSFPLPHPAELQDIADIKARLQRLESHLGVLSGRELFTLYDTYGFPPELTAEIAREHGLSVDLEGFQREMEAQRERARAAHAFKGRMEMLPVYETLGVGKVAFVGYENIRQESAVAAILVEQGSVAHARQGQQVELVLHETPFYPEGGGQVGDRGSITGPNGVVRVDDTQSPVAGLIVHHGVVEQGHISLGDPVTAQVDVSRRLDSARNHSGTHLLHAALRAVLGAHVRQAGSLVAPERLRFDFSHISPLSSQEQLSIQNLANQKIRENLRVSAHETSYAEAVREGALAFFGDRYGDVVRVVEMSAPDAEGGAFSLEVCGGTHVAATGQVGTLFVLGEASIGGGMRRIEAVTGRAAEQLFVDQAAKLETLSQKLETPVADLEARLDSFILDNEELKRRLAALERAALRAEAEELLSRVMEVDGAKVVAGRTSANSADAMREMGDFLKAKLSSAVVVLATVVEGRPLLVAMVTPDLVARGLHAGNIARDTARVMGGGGGGRPEIAQAGGKEASKLDQALRRVPELVRQGLQQQ